MSRQEPEDSSSQLQVDLAIAAVLSQPAPEEALSRALEGAQRWEADLGRRAGKSKRWVAGLLAAAAAVVLLGIGLIWANSKPGRQSQRDAVVKADFDKPSSSSVATDFDEPSSDFATFYEPIPMANPEWAAAAPVFVTIGPEKPVKLGAIVKHNEYGRGLTPAFARLHIFDWSKSNESRVLLVKRSQLGVLSPTGNTMLSKSGEVTDLATGAVRKLPGFESVEGRLLCALHFSPSGKHTAQFIHVRVAEKPESFRWLLRIADFDTGKTIGEFTADPSAGIAFAPDEASFVASNGKNSIVRHELATGKMLNQYQPALEPHGAVGLAVSPAGRFVAAGHYHGELYVWELQTGKLVVHHEFVRDNGERDQFFQAKIIKFSPDGELLAMASNGRLKILETKTGKIKVTHYHATTPTFVHLNWSPDAKSISLLTYSDVAEFDEDRGFPGKGSADRLPRIYEWKWQSGGPPVLRE